MISEYKSKDKSSVKNKSRNEKFNNEFPSSMIDTGNNIINTQYIIHIQVQHVLCDGCVSDLHQCMFERNKGLQSISFCCISWSALSY